MILTIDNFQITVKNMLAAEEFYDKLMPVLGYNLENKIRIPIPEDDLYVVRYLHPAMDFAICSPNRDFKGDTVHGRKPGAIYHIALRAESWQQVDWIYELIKNIADITEPPRMYTEHGLDYYALYFRDPDGIRFGIIYNKPTERPENFKKKENNPV